jgi:mono/diheme cytochrome c family protein
MHRLLIAAAAAGTIAVALPALNAGKNGPARAEPTHTVWDGVYADSQAAAGAQLFESKGCVKCHGMDLKGTDDGAALVGDEFFGDFEGSTLGGLYDQIWRQMPPTAPKSIAPPNVVQLIAFILSRNHFPSGSTPLSTDSTRLNDIKLVQHNPNALPSNMTRTVDTVRIGDTLRVIETIYIRGKTPTDTMRLEDLKIFPKH